MADRKVVVEKDEDKTSGRSEREDEGTTHVTTFVDIPGVGSLRSSYDENEEEGVITNQHMTLQRKDD